MYVLLPQSNSWKELGRTDSLSCYLSISIYLPIFQSLTNARKLESQTGTLNNHRLEESHMILQWLQQATEAESTLQSNRPEEDGVRRGCWASICGIYSFCIHFLYTGAFPCTGHISLLQFTVPVYFPPLALGRAVQSGWEMCAYCSSYLQAWGIQGQRPPIRVTWIHKTSIWLLRQHKKMQTMREALWETQCAQWGVGIIRLTGLAYRSLRPSELCRGMHHLRAGSPDAENLGVCAPNLTAKPLSQQKTE